MLLNFKIFEISTVIFQKCWKLRSIPITFLVSDGWFMFFISSLHWFSLKNEGFVWSFSVGWFRIDKTKFAISSKVCSYFTLKTSCFVTLSIHCFTVFPSKFYSIYSQPRYSLMYQQIQWIILRSSLTSLASFCWLFIHFCLPSHCLSRTTERKIIIENSSKMDCYYDDNH